MKIAVLVSGGVDSSVALKLLKDQGHDITAFYLKIWLEDELAYLGDCPWQEDLGYVTAVCEKLDVPLEVISLQKEYHERIVSYVISEIKAGRTPNPDILCNQHIKFGAFFERSSPGVPRYTLAGTRDERAALGDASCVVLAKPGETLVKTGCDSNILNSFDKVATGHYAQVFEQDNKFFLKTSPDLIKDQTYFLSRLSQEQLSRALFPIGHLTKPELRELASEFDLPTKNRKDSQGICFLGKLKYSEFIKFHVGEKVGNLVEFETGKKLGTHKGFWFYTIGQRQGTGLSGGPWYVVSKDTVTNTVFISRNYYTDNMQRDRLIIENCNWISGAPKENKQLFVKLRHGQSGYICELSILEQDRFMLKLSNNDQGIAPGQFAVLYDGEICLGSGVISC